MFKITILLVVLLKLITIETQQNLEVCLNQCENYNNSICLSQMQQCNVFCDQFQIKSKQQINWNICINSCLVDIYEHNLSDNTLQYINCQNNCHKLPEIVIDIDKQEKNLIKYKNTIGQHNQVILLDFAYYKPLSKEPMVRNYFENKGYTNIHFSTNTTDEFYLHWAFTASKINWNIFKPGEQITNQIQNNVALTQKMGLVKTLRKFDELQQNQNYNSTYFFAESYLIDLSQEGYDEEEAEILKLNPPQWWILKPDRGFGGEGIRVIKDVKSFQKQFTRRKDKGIRLEKPTYILQKYMMNPLLINNKKFDLRYFVVVPSSEPFFALLYKGFIRKGLFDFSINENEQNDDYIHITNVAIQRQHPDYEKQKEDQIWLFDRFEGYLQDNFEQEKVEKLFREMKKALSYTLQAGKSEFILKKGMFQFFTFDFMIDDELNPYLIEVNGSPSWVITNDIYKKLKVDLYHNMMDLVLFLHKQPEKIEYYLQNFEELNNLGINSDQFEVIINDATGFNYHDQINNIQ